MRKPARPSVRSRRHRFSPRTLAILGLGWIGLVGPAKGAPGDFRFVILGDRTGSATPGIYESVLEEVNLLAPDFEVTVGDQIEGYTEDPAQLAEQWAGYTELSSRLAAPVYLCPGNHDITTDGMVEAWRTSTGHETCYSFDREGVHFVIFDTGRWESSADWMERSGYHDWLAGDLKAHRGDRLTVVIFHKPYWFDTLAEGKPDPLHDLFREFGVDYVFNGHFHVYGSAEYDGIRYTIVGSSGGAIDGEDESQGVFFQYLWCTVRGNAVDWAVMRRGSALSPETVAVADLKFFAKVATEYVRLEPLRLPEDAGGDSVSCRLSLRNATLAAMQANPEWQIPANWGVSPPRREVALDPGMGVSLGFEVRPAAGVYPLPRLRMAYPYRTGRSYPVDLPLPALRTQKVGRLAARPVIDGVLEEAAWARTHRAVEFGSPEGDTCRIEDTAISFGYDNENLYIGALCRQADMSSLVTKAGDRDGPVTRDDCVGFFFCPDPAETCFVQVYFNAAGVVFDQRVVITGPGQYGGQGPKWNGDYQASARKGPDAWVLEAAIPFATLGTRMPAPGEEWRANFRRKEMSKGSSADWQFPIGYEPQRFGYLRFE